MKKSFLTVSALLLWANTALAQTQFSTPAGTNSIVPGAALLIPKLNSAGINGQPQMIPPTTANPVPVVIESGGAATTVDQGAAAVVSSAWPVTLAIGGALNAVGNPVFVAPGTGASFAVTGTFFQATQPVSGTFWQATQPVSGTFFQATQPVSAASLPLPSGAATSALQTTMNTTLGSPFQAGGSIGNTTFAATESGTWTVQPGNTANTTPWLASISQGGNTGVVRAASSAPLATDPAPVFLLRPDSPGVITLGAAAAANSVPTIPASDYPAAAVPITITATGTTGATTATLPGTSGKTTYICGFDIGADATAFTVGTATITGTITATMSFRQGVGAAASATFVTKHDFSKCIPASAQNTGIAVVSIAAGTGGNTIVTAWGYQL